MEDNLQILQAEISLRKLIPKISSPLDFTGCESEVAEEFLPNHQTITIGASVVTQMLSTHIGTVHKSLVSPLRMSSIQLQQPGKYRRPARMVSKSVDLCPKLLDNSVLMQEDSDDGDVDKLQEGVQLNMNLQKLYEPNKVGRLEQLLNRSSTIKRDKSISLQLPQNQIQSQRIRTDLHGNMICKNKKKHKITFRDEVHLLKTNREVEDSQQGNSVYSIVENPKQTKNEIQHIADIYIVKSYKQYYKNQNSLYPSSHHTNQCSIL